jgi:Cu(I)/Ag(I) efflux system membrane fusion protein
MKAIEPWLLEGAPVHYRNARLTLYRDADSGKQWLQESGPARNPYGDGSSETIEWPDPMVGMDAAESERPAIDPHSGHR